MGILYRGTHSLKHSVSLRRWGGALLFYKINKKTSKKFWFLNLKSIIQCYFLGSACFCNFMPFSSLYSPNCCFLLKKKKKKWLEQCGYIYYIWVGCFSWKEILRRTLSANRELNDDCLYVGSSPIFLKPQCRNCCLVDPKGLGIPRGITLGPSPVLHTFSSTSSSVSSTCFCVSVVPSCIPEQTIPFL